MNFTLSSVGIQARGRTSILKLNYRNTREILQFAFEFAKEFMQEKTTDDDSVPLIMPEVAGNSGPKPVFKFTHNMEEEIEFICKCLKKWHAEGVLWKDIAIIYGDYAFSSALQKAMKQHNIPHSWLIKNNRKNYNPENDKVTMVTQHSSKGLEFPRVIVAGIGQLKDAETDVPEQMRLLYVAMTRAQEALLLTASNENCYVRRFLAVGR